MTHAMSPSNFVAALRTATEAVGNMFSRHVTVDLTLSPQGTLDATGRTQYTDKAVVALMPRPQSAQEEIFFFKLGRFVSDDEVEREFDLRGLKPVSPHSLAKINQDDPAFADTHPNGTHWKDANGNWCFATFNPWSDERSVSVDRDGGDWSDGWWFGGLRK